MDLFDAVVHGKFQKVKELVEQNIDIIHENNDFHFRAAIGECKKHLGIIKYLVEKGAKIHANNDYALRWSIIHKNFDIVKYLLSLYTKTELKELFFNIEDYYNSKSKNVSFYTDYSFYDDDFKKNNFYVKCLILERYYEL